MAHALSITDGTTTFSLSTTNAYLQLYVPVEAQPGEQAVAESVELTFYAASAAAMQTAIQTLQRLLDGIRRRQAWGVGPAVYLNFQPDGDATTWRSEMLDARLEYKEDALSVYPQAKMPATLVLQRVPFWEGALTQIPLTNASASNSTSGITIYNHDDSGTNHDNYVQIAAADVGGSLPAPVKVELTNNTGGSLNYKWIWLANNAFSDPANFPHILEGEAFVAGGGSTGSNADSSSSSYATIAVTGENYQQWTLSASLLTKAAGYDFHLMARFRSVNNTVYIRPSIYESTGTSTLWRGSETQVGTLSDAIVDLGVIPLPPGGYSSAYGAQRLQLYYRTASTVTVQLDFLAFFPANTFRRLALIPPQAANTKITDDQPEGRAYVVSGSAETPAVVTAGVPLLVWPNTLQRVYVLHSFNDLSADIAKTLSVKMWYRPRRASF
jgi:hypothetical protein